MLTSHGQRILDIPGRTVHHASHSYRGDGKTDAKDTYVIADQARMRSDLQPLQGWDEIAVDLKILTARRYDLAADRTRAINRMRAQLPEYFPALERAFEYAASKGALVLLTGYQTPAALRRIGPSRLASWLKNRKVRGTQALADTAVAAAQADDFALRRRHRYATVIIDAETHERIDVLPDRTADTLEVWLREHPGVEVLCRDGSATYAEAIRRALPDAVQVADRWHVWKNLCEAALSEVKAHSTCWATVLDAPIYDGPRAQTTLERWHQVHGLLDQGVGLLECARRLQLALNTVKRYARADRPERMLRVPKYRASLVDPYREHLRKRRAQDPSVPVKHLFEEIKALGFTGCLNLLHKYINQGRADADRSHISPRRLARMVLTRPDNLKAEQHELLAKLTAACPEMTQLATIIRDFAPLLTPHVDNTDALTRWIAQVRAADLPHLHAFARGLERDRDAVIAGLTLPYSNGPTEGVNTKTKRLARQMHGRAGFTLLRHRILLG
ncbi:ISL3 family transposase [Streptomyces sp. NPDC054802]